MGREYPLYTERPKHPLEKQRVWDVMAGQYEVAKPKNLQKRFVQYGPDHHDMVWVWRMEYLDGHVEQVPCKTMQRELNNV